MKKNLFIFDIILLLGLSLIFIFLDIRICPFFNMFKIPCPGCGLTRSILCLIKFNFRESISYNILGLIITIVFIAYICLLIIKKDKYFIDFICKNKKIIIILAVIMTIIVEFININNYKLY